MLADHPARRCGDLHEREPADPLRLEVEQDMDAHVLDLLVRGLSNREIALR